MKKNILIIALLSLSISFNSCESFLADGINVDQNKPSVVPVNAQMPHIAINIANVYGGDISRFATMLSQQVEGVARQWSSFNQYTGLSPFRFDTAWSNCYENVLIEVQAMTNAASTDGYNHYAAAGKTLEAFTLLTMTDLWGDIPYSEAISGFENINPTFDSRTGVIYPKVMSLLDEAASGFNASSGGKDLGSDDVIYGGNVDLWKKAVNAIKARAYLHKGDYSSALSNAKASFSSRADNFSFQFTADDPANWWNFNNDRTGDIEFHPTLRGMMEGLNDTARLAILDQTFITSHPYLSDDYNQGLVTYREMQFVIAEALHRTGGSAAEIETAYLNGIKASFDEVGASSSDYDTYVAQASVNPGAGNIKLEDHILTQKYIGLFVDPEVFNDLRRNSFPKLTPVSGSQLPTRFQYSSDELLFNSNSPADGATTLFTPTLSWSF